MRGKNEQVTGGRWCGHWLTVPQEGQDGSLAVPILARQELRKWQRREWIGDKGEWSVVGTRKGKFLLLDKGRGEIGGRGLVQEG